MKQLFSIVLVFVLLLGCTNKADYIVPQEKMVDVIYDLTVASSARSTSNKRDSVQYVVSYQQLLKKHGIDSLKFVKAQEQYRKNPETYAAIYDSVHKKLQTKLEEARALKADKNEEGDMPILEADKLSFPLRKK